MLSYSALNQDWGEVFILDRVKKTRIPRISLRGEGEKEEEKQKEKTIEKTPKLIGAPTAGFLLTLHGSEVREHPENRGCVGSNRTRQEVKRRRSWGEHVYNKHSFDGAPAGNGNVYKEGNMGKGCSDHKTQNRPV